MPKRRPPTHQPELSLTVTHPKAKVHRIQEFRRERRRDGTSREYQHDFDVVICPHCDCVQDLDDCDTIGADNTDDGGVFCCKCNQQFDYEP